MTRSTNTTNIKMTQYQEFTRHSMPEVSQEHSQAALDLCCGVRPMCLTNALLRLSDPANDAYYAHTQHRVAHLSVIKATMLMPGSGLAVSYLDDQLKPRTILAKALQSIRHLQGTRFVLLFDTYQEDYVWVPIDGIFKLTMETMSLT